MAADFSLVLLPNYSILETQVLEMKTAVTNVKESPSTALSFTTGYTNYCCWSLPQAQDKRCHLDNGSRFPVSSKKDLF
ncbi:Hypothetical predicted protein [Octopus vulgaris]|uniref:Uncharacterized protein n=1 Tax=Octopus vulgaris TaxID=6645 RepID=A0AA36BR24_OCTVU|nr:Hypothetical predicted protein [Octopus vulgaris]